MKQRKWYIVATVSMLTTAISVTGVTTWYTQHTEVSSLFAAVNAISTFATNIVDGDVLQANPTDTPDGTD